MALSSICELIWGRTSKIRDQIEVVAAQIGFCPALALSVFLLEKKTAGVIAFGLQPVMTLRKRCAIGGVGFYKETL
jgi:hypothetical protein